MATAYWLVAHNFLKAMAETFHNQGPSLRKEMAKKQANHSPILIGDERRKSPVQAWRPLWGQFQETLYAKSECRLTSLWRIIEFEQERMDTEPNGLTCECEAF
jgi:hypothetical protein